MPKHIKTITEIERHNYVRSITSQYPNAIKLINKQTYYDYVFWNTDKCSNLTNLNIDDDGVISSKGDDLQPLIDDIVSDIHSCHSIDETTVIHDLRQLSNNYKQKQFRNNKKVAFLLTSPCVFLTLTWNDKTLSETNETTRRRYVKQYLNSLGVYYLGNIDYGDEKGREHYHALVQCETVDITVWRNLHNSSINVKRIKTDRVKSNNLTRYILKLSNHSCKTSTRSVRVLCNIPRDVIKSLESESV